MSEKLERPLMGVREFSVDVAGNLYSPIRDNFEWKPDQVTRARCQGSPLPVEFQQDPHEAPGDNCRCGYYAFNTLAESQRYGVDADNVNLLRAVVSAWGEVVAHDLGFRAEYMQIEAVIVSPDSTSLQAGIVGRLQSERPDSPSRIADRFAVPLIADCGVDAFCREHGEVLESSELSYDQTASLVQISARISDSFKSMVEDMKPILQRMNMVGQPDNRAAKRKPANFQEALEKKRNKPAFWRDYAGGDVHGANR